MNKYSILLLAIGMIVFITAGANAQIQNVLLEQHTGAWCGWCPDGNVKMDEVIDLYGDQVIGVKFHNNDDMAIPEQISISEAQYSWVETPGRVRANLKCSKKQRLKLIVFIHWIDAHAM
jgi:hypothetical protein